MKRALLIFPLFALTTIAPLSAEPRQDWIDSNLSGVVELYQHLHRNPELSFQEEQTAARLAEELKALDIAVTKGIGGHGVVGILENGEGPRLMLRSDTDALPVTEQTQLVYASRQKVENDSGETVGVMHACGHDIHMANLVGVARYLAGNRSRWQGTVMFVFQPAEERGAGAKAMLDDGLFERFPKPDLALALHVDSTLATGSIGYRAGYALANVNSVDITMLGRGGHGAYPQATIDPVVMAAQLIVDLQSIVSREVAPTDPAVVTVGSIHGGTKHNVISDQCHLQLTVRSYTDEVRRHLLEAIQRKAKAVAQGAGAPEPIVKVSEGTPALFNDEKLVKRVVPAFEQLLGKSHVVGSEPSMGGEDFSRYGRAGVPIFMYRLGSVDAQRLAGFARVNQPPPSLHSSVYYPDAEETLKTGLMSMTTAVETLLPPGE
jgi:hippurate hydrolase